ncbi:unnamed protein product [Amoebophrya sp. A120]|nr:unnamed protein product [Amoebophrya sp. A120]|eukprot:GSA120T00010969001.1
MSRKHFSTSTRTTGRGTSTFLALAFLTAVQLDSVAVFACESSKFYCPETNTLESDCTKCGDYKVSDADSDPKVCIKRQVFSSKYWVHDLFGVLIWFVGAGLAMAAGVGGGGIFVPVGILLLRFGAKTATGLSQASIFGASIAGLVINLQNRHPLADRPLIDLDMALFLAPMEMAGAVLGVLVQKFLPDWAVILIMAVILGQTGRLTFKKAFKQHEKDKKLRAEKEAKKNGPTAAATSTENNKPSSSTAIEDAPAAITADDVNVEVVPAAVTQDREAGMDESAPGAEGDDPPTGQPNEVNTPAAGPSATGSPCVVAGDSKKDTNLNLLDNSTAPKAATSSPQACLTIQTENLDQVANRGEEDVHVVHDAQPGIMTSQPAPVSLLPANVSQRLDELEAQSPKWMRSKRDLDHVYGSTEWLTRDSKQPWRQFGYLFVLWIFLLLVLLFRGGKGMDSLLGDELVPMCGEAYWSFTALAFVFLFGFGVQMARRAVHKSVRKQAVDYPFVEGDVLWTFEKAAFYARWTFLAGILAGLIGIGGGMVLGPLMLQMGVLPQVSTATTATLIALTSSSAALMFVSSGLVPWSYSVLFCVVAFVGALLGKSKIDKVVKEKQMTSILIFLLAFLICFATLMITLAGLLKYEKQDWCFEGIQQMCK